MEKLIRKTESGRFVLVNPKIHVELLQQLFEEMDEFFTLKECITIENDRREQENKRIIIRLIRSNWLKYDKKKKEISLSSKAAKYIIDYGSFLNEQGPLMKKCKEKVNKKTTEIRNTSQKDVFLGEY